MRINVTARHFRAHDSLVSYAESEVAKLGHYYDGIMKCDLILKYEKPRKSDKIAEAIVSVYGTRLAGKAQSDDFFKSIDAAIMKVLVQLKKYKAKLHAKDRKMVRQVRAKSV